MDLNPVKKDPIKYVDDSNVEASGSALGDGGFSPSKPTTNKFDLNEEDIYIDEDLIIQDPFQSQV